MPACSPLSGGSLPEVAGPSAGVRQSRGRVADRAVDLVLGDEQGGEKVGAGRVRAAQAGAPEVPSGEIATEEVGAPVFPAANRGGGT